MLSVQASRRRLLAAAAAAGTTRLIGPVGGGERGVMAARGESVMQTEDAAAIMLSAGEGSPYWTMGMLMTIKASTTETGGANGVMDALMPAGSAPPFHIHRGEAEINYVLDGVITFQCGDQVRECGPGAFIFLPSGIPYRFKAGPEGARMLSVVTPGGLEQLYIDVGEPAPALRLPDLPPNVAGWLARAAAYGIDVVGPPLG